MVILLLNRNVNTHFNNNPTSINISRSVFNRDHSIKFSFDVGDLIPFMVDEVLPGDTVSIDTSKVVRIQPLVAPLMDEIFLDTYYFFVPNRLVWSHWQEFMGEREEGSIDSPSTLNMSLTVPAIKAYPKLTDTSKGYPIRSGSIYDYMGFPTGIDMAIQDKFNALPIRAYNLIYNDWFRAESFQNPVKTFKDINTDMYFYADVSSSDPIPFVGGDNGRPFRANKTFDYFTSCLPSPQKGPDVSIAQGINLPVYFGQDSNPLLKVGASQDEYLGKFGKPKFVYTTGNNAFADSAFAHSRALYADNSKGLAYSSNDVTSGVATQSALISNAVVEMRDGFMTVNELREAFAIQRYYEKAARGGSRYIELIKTFFGVTSPDARMQRSEYLGGSRLYLGMDQVVQTSATEFEVTPQGNVTGLSVTNDTHSDFTKSFTEHGYIIGLAVARYHHTYQRGIERLWSRRSVFDFYNPTFANIGEQPVLRKEIYYTSNHESNESVFGYNEAWADYRYKPSRVAGEMRSGDAHSLDCWHLADVYNDSPRLSMEWLRETKAPLDRCLAVTSEQANQLIADFYIQANWARAMPLYSVPGLIDHN